jgi:peroxiredoxin
MVPCAAEALTSEPSVAEAGKERMSTHSGVRAILVLALGVALGTNLSSDAPRVGPSAEKSLTAGVTLWDATGQAVSLASLRRGSLLVLAFIGTECPIANLYCERLEGLSRNYRGRAVTFLGINSNNHESVAEIAEHAKTYGLTFPVLKDPENRLADLLDVERTCEVLVLDVRDRILYRGTIDDQYSLKAHRDRPTREYLVAAINAVLAGREVAEPATPVIGCPIDRVDLQVARRERPRFRPASPEIRAVLAARERVQPVRVGSVTYAADVAPILQAKCQPCHRSGQVGRFSLTTYTQARRWAASIEEVVEERRMPPWHADPRYGHFENDRSLSAQQRATLLAWVAQGTPPGDLSKQPPPKQFSDEWRIGEPDVVLEMPEEFQVPATGAVPYQHFRVKTHFTEDRWVQALEARPGNRAVVHHIVVFVDDGKKLLGDPLRHMKTHLVSFAPGDLPSVYSPGTAKLIPAGADLIFEMHYTPIGTAMPDRSKVGLIFANTPPARRAYTMVIRDRDIAIPPGEPNYEARASYTFTHDAHLLSFMPHMHLRGKDFVYKAVYPDGRSEILLSVPAFDFAWQSIYRLAEPLELSRGTRIECVAHFDNSAQNPANPDPTKRVLWGEQTWDEMMIGFFDFAEDLPPYRIARRRRSSRK